MGGKLAGATIALIVVVTIGVYLGLSRSQREHLLQSKELSAVAVTQLFSDSCAAAVIFEDSTTIKEDLGTLGRNEDVVYAAVVAIDRAAAGKPGRVLGELRRDRPEPSADAPQAIRLRRQVDRVVVEAPIRDQEGHIVATAVVAFSLARENQAIARVKRTTLIVSTGVALLLMALLFVVARVAIVGPLGKLVRAANALERGADRAEVDVHSNDEVGQLARAFRSMAAAIAVREDRINTRNRDMRLVLDNVGQGFITLDGEGTMAEERSRVVDAWFGAAGESMKFWEYLRRFDQKMGDNFEVAWFSVTDDVLPLSLALDQLPSRARKGSQILELAYRPIMEGARLGKVIVVVTDITARIERELSDQAQRELMSLFRRMRSDRAALDHFFVEEGARIDAITRGDGVDAALLRRNLHTVKGDSALFGLDSVASYCHTLEDRLSESAEPLSPEEKQTLAGLWAKVQQMYAQLLSGSGEGNIELASEEYLAFMRELRARLGHDPLVEAAAAWPFEPASKRLTLFGEQIRELAKRLGKAAVDVTCESADLRLPPSRWGPFWSTFSHVIRNTVDHGLEVTDERRAAGKAETASVTLGIAREGANVVVTVTDDGRGVDWGKIAIRAAALGLPYESPVDLEQALFIDGISSRDSVTNTSGRGVGLSAVRAMVRELGGEVRLFSTAGFGTTLRFVFPPAMLSEDPTAKAVRRAVRAPSGATPAGFRAKTQ